MRRGVRGIGGVLLLLVRSLLLWIVVPIGFIAWATTCPWQIKRKVSLGQFIGWIDSNMVIAIERSVLRPFFTAPTHRWVPIKDRDKVKNRIGLLDPF